MKRLYHLLEEEIRSLQNDNFKLESRELLVKSKVYNLYILKTSPMNVLPCISLSAGIHGDEEAGVYALLDFLPKIKQYTKLWNFIIFPCLNPLGYALRTRTFNRGDLNRGFWYDGIYEVNRIVMNEFRTYKPVIAIDMHEDDAATSFSVFETTKNKEYVEFEEMDRLVPLLRARFIDGLPAKNGIIHSKLKSDATLENFAYRNGAKIAITVELPGRLNQYDRAKIGQKFLELIFDKFKKSYKKYGGV